MPARTPGPRLKRLVKLSKRKEVLLAELQNIDREMVSLERELTPALGKPKGKGRVTFSDASRRSRQGH